MQEKINVIWICTISNLQIHSCINFNKWYCKNIIKHIFRRPISLMDRAQWNSNGIHEFEKFNDVKLTVVFPYEGIKGTYQKFSINNIDYIPFKADTDNLLYSFKYHLLKKREREYVKSRKTIRMLIDEIKPDIIHIIGAENPPYSIHALDVPHTIPCVVSLQTLIADPRFHKDRINEWQNYAYREDIEFQVLKRADYIAASSPLYRSIVTKSINKDAIFMKMFLALGVDINTTKNKKEYDFVYFALNIDKAADYAIEAFGLACKKKPELTLNISGLYNMAFKEKLDSRIKELGIEKNVFITGPKQSHDEVIDQIKKSRFALLPLKVDLISGTIREAMACGLPVVTTITPGTPDLNSKRESVLLSPIGDYKTMAENMLRLVEDEAFASEIRENAIITVKERYSNETFMKMWRKAYYEIIDNFKNGTPFSEDVIFEG